MSSGIKRRNSERAVLNCLSRDVVSPRISSPNTKRFRRCVDVNARPTKVRWETPLICTGDVAPCNCVEYNEAESGDKVESMENQNEKWYSVSHICAMYFNFALS